MSGSDAIPVVRLMGTSMSGLVQAIPVITARTGRQVIVIGGLAVVCRLNRPYRSTSDLDTVNRRSGNEPGQLELLVSSGAEPSGVSGVLVPTAAGDVQVDVLEVSDAELADLPTDRTDRLHVLSHDWAAATSTPISIQSQGLAALVVQVAEVGPLIAMKLQSIMNRGAAKEGTDLLDIVRLTLDQVSGPHAQLQLATANDQLREDASAHAKLWFADRAERALRLVRAVPEGKDTVLDDLLLVGELLQSALNQQDLDHVNDR